jgi:hypothetical protein
LSPEIWTKTPFVAELGNTEWERSSIRLEAVL